MNRTLHRLALAGLLAALAGGVAAPPAAADTLPAPPLPKGQLFAYAISKPDKVITYLVVDSVKAHDGLVEFTALMVWAPPKVINGARIEQAMASHVVDCGAHTVQRVSAAIYDDTGVGVDSGEAGKGSPVPIPANSGLEGLAKTLCENGKLDASIMLEGDAAGLAGARYVLGHP